MLGLHATAGCHPTSTKEISERSEDDYFRELEDVIRNQVGKGTQRRLVAIGEIGLGAYPTLPEYDWDLISKKIMTDYTIPTPTHNAPTSRVCSP